MTNKTIKDDRSQSGGRQMATNLNMKHLQYEKLTPSLAGSLRSWTTAVPSATLTLSLLRQTVWTCQLRCVTCSSKPTVKKPQYSLELRVQHLDGAILPYGVVRLDALSSLKGCWELLDLIPPTHILLTGRRHQHCTVRGMEECMFSSVLLPVER